MKKTMIVCVMALVVTSAQAVNVDIYEGFTQVGGGAPYKGLVGSFVSADVQFATNTGYAWHPFGLDRFGAEMTGCLNVEADRGYEFGLSSDDGSMLYIDGVLVVDNGGPHSPQNAFGKTFLTRGLHSFRVEFFEDHGGPSGVDLILPKGVTYTPCEVYVPIDIKPGSCPNPLNVKDKGVLPVAILGSADFDVFTVDPASVRLQGVAPIRSSYEDVSTPVFDPEDECACTTDGPDGCFDLSLKFNVQEILFALGQVHDGESLPLILTGKDFDGAPLIGLDCVVVIDKTKRLITSVLRDGVTEGQPIIVAGQGSGGLKEGAHAYMDRPIDEFDTRNYHWENVPGELVRADYVMTYNEDKRPIYPDVYDVAYAVTLAQDAMLYVFVDRRYVDEHGDPPFKWLIDGSAGAVFEDTGLDIVLNEVGGSDVLRPFDIYGAEVPAGIYVLGASCDGNGSRNFYGIAAVGL